MIRRPPRSTPFPTRRSSDLLAPLRKGLGISSHCPPVKMFRPTPRAWRSEEHTSELQSHHDLVCRLLLEKKKNNSDTLFTHRPTVARLGDPQALTHRFSSLHS